MRYEVCIGISAEPDAVWATLAGVARWPEWSPTMTSVVPLGEDFKVGSRFRVKQPHTPVAVWEVTECEQNSSFVWATRFAGGRMVAGHTIASDGPGATTVRLTVDYTGGLSSLLAPLVGRRIERYLHTEAASLKKHCEAVGKPAG